jgi:ATP-dependent DNA helicase PIF1
MLTSPIQRNDPRGELIRLAGLITLDEASMLNRAALGCTEDVCKQVMNNNEPFGGKVFILLGDFRQTCPVIRGGSRAQVIDACIQSSPLWHTFRIRRLPQLIRNAEDPEFADFVNSIGDGAGPEICLDILPRTTDLSDIIDFVYPPQILCNPSSCLERGILAPTNKQVDSYNDILLERVQGVSKQYMAADSIKEATVDGMTSPDATLDFVARQTPPGLPPHHLLIKTHAVYRLLRNLSLDRQLVKNVRVVVTEVGNRIVTLKVLRDGPALGNEREEEIVLPRISVSHQLSSGHTLLRRKFALAPAYSTTFHSCEGLTFDFVGVDLTRPVFTHGQLYTALSRI